jgi:hypothetical protein
VTTTSTECSTAAIMLFANHTSTGVPLAVKIASYACVVNGFGIQLGGMPPASARVLNEVTSMKRIGLM